MRIKKFPQKITVTVEKLVSGGKGLARYEGKTIFIPGVLPGERVLVYIQNTRKDYCNAEVISILEPNETRRLPPCQYQKKCGGCDWMHIEYPTQLELKKAMVMESFQRIGKQNISNFHIQPSPEFNYRRRFQFHKSSNKLPGLKRRSGTEVVQIEKCLVAAPPINSWLSQKPELELSRTRLIAGDDVLAFDNGPLETQISICNKKFQLGASCFFQANRFLVQDLVKSVVEGVRGELAWDLFCGVGLFGVFLADGFDQVIGVEQNRSSVNFAIKNVNNAEINNFRIVCSDVFQWINNYQGEKPDLVVLDPPRLGLNKEMISLLGKMKIASLCYIACDPVALARDAAWLSQAGYEMNSLQGFDLYPQTSHVEVVAKFQHPQA